MAVRPAFGARNRDRAHRILVCEDDPGTARLLQVCGERAGHQVEIVDCGLAALARLQDKHFDMLILDLMLPDIDGLDVLKALRGDPATEDLPIIVISGRSGDSDIFQSYHCGADMHLKKPFNPQELFGFLS